jgi:hypothetical protein
LLVLEISKAALDAGEVVPIPIEPEVVMLPEVFTFVTEEFPSCTVLLAVTSAA